VISGFFVEQEDEMSSILEPIHKVLLAIDGSEHSRAALQTVQDLALISANCPDCQVMILGVLPLTEGLNHAAYKYPLIQGQNMLGEQGIQASYELIQGIPAEVILNYAAKKLPDLIVVGAKGLRATLGILLGGVAQQVVEYACCPVLVIRAPYRKLSHVLIVTDGSEHSRRAVEYAATFPFLSGTYFHLLHVLPPSPTLSTDTLARVWSYSNYTVDLPVFTYPEDEEDAEAIRKAGQVILEQAHQILVSHGIAAKNVLLRGDAATEILQYAENHQIDLIIVGSRGLSQVQSWLLGSVSRKLVHYSGCSVLLVKHPSDAAGEQRP
jgi:nucleotide-binding universal stress UspA family protein